MNRISSLSLHNATVGSALNVQSQLAQALVQESTGLVAQDFGTLGGGATTEMLNLQDEISQAQTFSAEAQTVGDRTQAMYNAIGNMTTIVNQLQVKISQAMSSPDNSGLALAAQKIQEQLVGQMNAASGGRYLFAGSNIATAPVSLANYPTLQAAPPASYPQVPPAPSPGPYYDPNLPDPSYYTGDTNILSVHVSLQQAVSYGVNADNPAFDEALRATQAVIAAAQAVPALSQAQLNQALQTALDLSNSAVKDLSNLQESVAVSSSQLKDAQHQQATYVTLLQNSLSNVKDVDAAQVASQVQQFQTQLQASYMAVASITKISLVQYL